jgi:hypothetical protein
MGCLRFAKRDLYISIKNRKFHLNEKNDPAEIKFQTFLFSFNIPADSSPAGILFLNITKFLLEQLILHNCQLFYIIKHLDFSYFPDKEAKWFTEQFPTFLQSLLF